jgi:hypothetical protein
MFGTTAYAQSPFAAAQGNAFFAVIDDAAAASDSVFSLPTYSAQILETASSQDASSSQFVVYADAVEAVSGADTTASLSVTNAAVSETASGQDTDTAFANFLAQVTNTASGVDAVVGLPNYFVLFSASGASADSPTGAASFVCLVAVTADGTDNIIGQPLWVLIDDSQTPGWTDLLIPTIIEDINVFGGASFGTVSFAGALRQNYNPNPVVWNPINDTQDAEWTNIAAV